MQEPSPLYLADTMAGPPKGTLLARFDDLPAHGGKDIIFEEGDFRLNIFIQRHEKLIRIYENRCPHAGTPLNMVGEKFLTTGGEALICRTHGALFDIKSGKCTRGPCKGEYLRPVAFEVRDDGLYSI